MKKKNNSKINSFVDKLKNINIKDIFKFIINEVKNSIIYNRQFIAFILLSCISFLLCMLLTIGKFYVGAYFFDVALIIIIGSLGYFFKVKRQFSYWFTLLIIFTFLNIINAIYYEFFYSFVSVGLLESLGQTGEVTDAIWDKIKWYNFVYLIMPVIYFIYHRILVNKDYIKAVEKIEKSIKTFIYWIILGGSILFINIASLEGWETQRLAQQWNREYIVQRFGFLVYQGNDIEKVIETKINAAFGLEKAENKFNDYYLDKKQEHQNNKYTNTLNGYNVVVLHMESIMQFLIGLEINGVEVTPNLNKLVKEDNSMYFDNFYSQVSVGTSSDTEFTFNTSLMPVQSGTVFVSYYNRNYESLEKLLSDKKYYTFSMHGNKAAMWNRNKMHYSLGYKKFYDESQYELDEIVGLGLSDSSFFRQSNDMITEINNMVKDSNEYEHYMGTMLSLTNHTPFDDPVYTTGEDAFDITYHTGKIDPLTKKEIVWDYLKKDEMNTLGRYIQSVNYADKCIGELLNYINSNPAFDKTLFVFYGDHAAQISKSEFKHFINFDPLTGEDRKENDPLYDEYDYYDNEIFKKVPLIMFTKDKKIKGTYSYPMGMIDVLPTISNMLGVQPKYALGNDIFNIKNDNTVIFPNGNFLTKDVYYYDSQNNYKVLNIDSTLNADYIEDRKKYTSDILSLSNDIIVYDLIDRVEKKAGILDEQGN